MKFNPKIHHRRSIRLQGYDYSQDGAYFITICTKDRRHLFGRVANGEMILNAFGQIAHLEWGQLPERWPHIELGAFQIMPNHMHGILIIHPVGATARVAPTGIQRVAPTGTKTQWAQKPTVGQIVGAYKSLVVTESLKYAAAHNPEMTIGKIWHRSSLCIA